MSYRKEVNAVLKAAGFLTRCPVPKSATEGGDISSAAAYFSLVGLLVGLLGALPFLILPPVYGALLSILVTVVLTGAIHEDGLADTCDGLYGGHSPDSRREIMRDSRLGTFGAIGIWLALTLRFYLLRDLAQFDIKRPEMFPWLLPVVMAFSRTSAVVLLAVSGPDPEDEAKVSSRFSRVGVGEVLVSGFISLAVGFALLREYVLACLVTTTIVSAIFGLYFTWKLGRLGGDTLGAAVILVETACLAVLLSQLHGAFGDL